MSMQKQDPAKAGHRHAGLEGLSAVRVDHCHDAWGFVLRGSAGWKLAFSGDTRPSRLLCQAGAGATLLIHEATFEPAMHAQARCVLALLPASSWHRRSSSHAGPSARS